MWTDNLVIYKIKSYLIFFRTNVGVHKKHSPLVTSLYNQVYFAREDQFNLSMVSSDTWSDNYVQTS